MWPRELCLRYTKTCSNQGGLRKMRKASRARYREGWMAFIDRIGIDVGRRLSIEDAIAWAARHGVKAIDVQTDIAPNALETFDSTRCARVLEACEELGVSI